MFEHFAQNVFWHGGFLECQDRLWHVISFHDNLMLRSPLGGVFVAALCNVWVFQVKILFERDKLDFGEVNVVEVGPEVSTTTTAIATSSSIATSTTIATIYSKTTRSELACRKKYTPFRVK